MAKRYLTVAEFLWKRVIPKWPMMTPLYIQFIAHDLKNDTEIGQMSEWAPCWQNILSLRVIDYVLMYSLFHPTVLIVFIYQVWVDNRMCVLPVVCLLSIKQNVVSLDTEAGSEWRGCWMRMCYMPRIKKTAWRFWREVYEQLDSTLMSYHNKLLWNQSINQKKLACSRDAPI